MTTFRSRSNFSDRKRRGLIGAAVLSFAATVFAEEPVRVSQCELEAHPAPYTHKLVEVSGTVVHQFEAFVIEDPACKAFAGIWLEYGGMTTSPIVFCCCQVAGKRRSHIAAFEGEEVPLIKDPAFKAFDRLVRHDQANPIQATLVGRFFAASEADRGYGHFGMFSLLVIQQVIRR